MKFQFRNYIRAIVQCFRDSWVTGHVTPFLYKQPCFECTEDHTFLPCGTVLNAKKVADKK